MKAEQLPFDLGHRAAYEREDFWVSSSNSAAVAWIDKWPDWPAPALVLYGPPACGKTHLSRVWEKKSGGLRISAETVESVSGKGKAVIIDDVDSVIGRRKSEESLFHLYNAFRESGGSLLLTAKTAPAEWPFVLADLESRILAAPSVAMGSPDDHLMAVVLTKLFSDRQIFVSQDVISFILARIERSFSALRDIADAVDRRAMAEKRAVTIPLVRDILR